MTATASFLLPAVRDEATERSVRRRVAAIWALLVFNVLSFSEQPMLIRIPHVMGKVLTQGALGVALLLAVTVNHRLSLRPNVLLTLVSILAASSLMVSIRDEVSLLGTDYRALRLIAFVLILWLLTPWWGRKDMMLARINVWCLIVLLGSVLLGAVIAHHKAFEGGRLEGVIWPVPWTAVGQYGADLGGLVAVMWLAGIAKRRLAGVLFAGAVAVLLLSHTRTALVGMLVGIAVAALSLFASRRRVRKVLGVTLVGALLACAVALPFLTSWFLRGQSAAEFSDLTGRTKVWSALVHEPRSRAEMVFGFGLSNDGFDGLPIDNSWLAVYQDQGLVGDAICAVVLVCLFAAALSRPRGAARAMALFLIVNCAIASVTQTGLGGASIYLMDLTVAASLIMPEMPGSEEYGSLHDGLVDDAKLGLGLGTFPALDAGEQPAGAL